MQALDLNFRKQSLKNMILISGTPRSGTHYTAALLQDLGLKVHHEKLDADGTVSWKHIRSGTFAVPERKRSSEIFDPGFTTVIHQVRHPLKSISSMYTLRYCSWEFMARHVEIDLAAPLPVRAMQAWLGWNQIIGERAEWRFQIEELPEVFDQLLTRLKRPQVALPQLSHQSRESRTSRYTLLTWGNLLHADAALAEKVAGLAREYGYQVGDLAELEPVAAVTPKIPSKLRRLVQKLFKN